MGKLPHTKKVLGQHYLKDPQIIAKICQDFAGQAASIVEVGPGPGMLTKALAALQRPFIVIEKDPRFQGHLQELLPAEQIFLADALQFPLAELIDKQQLPSPLWLVSNLPYNISVPLLLRFVQIPAITYLTLMFQQEVAAKILPPIGQKNSTNSLMCLVQNYFQVRQLAKVRPGAFLPPPQVHSTVLSFHRHLTPAICLDQYLSYEQFLRRLFAWRRKQIGKVLTARICQQLDISPQCRAETLSREQISQIYQAMLDSPHDEH